MDNTNTDWAAAPAYNFTERDVITKKGSHTSKTYRVRMIEGSTYNQLIAIDDHPLPAAQAAEEQRKLQQETERRRSEPAASRRKRVAQYQKERQQDHALMTEMAKAFDYRLSGEETLNGRRCFVLQATPKPGYRPPNRDSQVLTGMRGKMWVDTAEYQWVKVEAEVFRPVRFGFVFAEVQPGTEFTLEQKAVQGNLWLPSHFAMHVKARVLIFSKVSADDESYSEYQRNTTTTASR